jgi:hypothetical protein
LAGNPSAEPSRQHRRIIGIPRDSGVDADRGYLGRLTCLPQSSASPTSAVSSRPRIETGRHPTHIAARKEVRGDE